MMDSAADAVDDDDDDTIVPGSLYLIHSQLPHRLLEKSIHINVVADKLEAIISADSVQ